EYHDGRGFGRRVRGAEHDQPVQDDLRDAGRDDARDPEDDRDVERRGERGGAAGGDAGRDGAGVRAARRVVRRRDGRDVDGHDEVARGRLAERGDAERAVRADDGGAGGDGG